MKNNKLSICKKSTECLVKSECRKNEAIIKTNIKIKLKIVLSVNET